MLPPLPNSEDTRENRAYLESVTLDDVKDFQRKLTEAIHQHSSPEVIDRARLDLDAVTIAANRNAQKPRI